jgi:N-acetylmuramoyl-L-alanine amidase-like protein
MMLTQLADVARRTGYPVIEVQGWKTRGHGPQIDVRTVINHHTANGGAAGNAPSLAVVQHGRPGLAGPLAHYLLGRDGTIYVVAAGLCWHAGVSRKTDYENPHSIGIEAEAVGVPGTKGDWPAVQMDSYRRLDRALIEEFHLTVSDVLGHKETCAPEGRKSDPDFDMNNFRAAVAAVNLFKPASMEDDMQWSDKIKLTAEDAKWWGTPYKEGDEVTIGLMLRYPTMARRTESELKQFIAQSAARDAALLAALKAPAPGGGTLTAAELAEAAEVGAEAALAKLGHALDGTA